MARAVDVVIIGAGVVGLSVAYELAQKSELTIAVFDKGGAGGGTSGKSAGVICRHDQGPVYQRLSLVGHERMLHFAREYGLGFHRWGSLSIVRHGEAFPPVDEPATELRDAPSGMYVTELLEPDDLHDRFPFLAPDGVLGAVFEPNVGFINPHELIALYRTLLCRSDQVSVDYGNPVLDFAEQRDGSVELTTRRGTWTAGTVVNASGAWAPKVAALAGTSVHITPQRMNVAVGTQDDANSAVPLHGVPEFRWQGDGLWCRGEIGGGTLYGQHRDLTIPSQPTADPDHFDHCPDPGFVEALAPLRDKYYRLPGSRLYDGWTCVYDTSDDGFPVVGRDAVVSSLVHAIGMNGHGMTIHAGIARCIAAVILDHATTIDISDVMPSPETLDFSILRPTRFEEGAALALGGHGAGHPAIAE